MDAGRAAPISSRPRAVSSPLVGLPLAVSLAAASLLFGLAAAVGWRRLAGAVHRPLDSFSLVATGLILSLTAAALHVLWHQTLRAFVTLGARLWLSALLAAAVLGLALSVSLPGSPPWPLALLWALVLGEQFVSGLAAVRDEVRARRHPGQPSRVPTVGAADPPAVGAPPARGDGAWRRSDNIALERELEPIPQWVSQQITRAKQQDGAEVLSGQMRSDFGSRQRNKRLHVAFCPPLASTPQLTVEQIDGPPATIKPAQVESFGARFDVRLASPADGPTSVVLVFAARAAPRGSRQT